ncbi:MAG: hypothetical protein ACM3PS_01065 [Syntrophothermus sp.]
MLPQILSAIPRESLAPIVTMMAFGAYHGLNPGMGWLFALSVGLQNRSDRAIWRSLFPIAAGHASSLALVAMLVFVSAHYISTPMLEITTALILIGFGIYKLFNYYRHPRWVGMQVGMRDLTWWSFLMSTAHGAGLMIAPLILTMALPCVDADTSSMVMAGDHAHMAMASANVAMGADLGIVLGLLMHTLAMLAVMALVAWFVYKRFGLKILRSHWINFDLIWAAALIIAGAVALLGSVGSS